MKRRKSSILKNKKVDTAIFTVGIAVIGSVPFVAQNNNLSQTVYASTASALVDEKNSKENQSQQNTDSMNKQQSIDLNSNSKDNNAVKQEFSSQLSSKETNTVKNENLLKQNVPTESQTKSKNQNVNLDMTISKSNQNLAQSTLENVKSKYIFDDVYVGEQNDRKTNEAITSLKGTSIKTLKDNSFEILSGNISGRKTLAIQGKDETGLFYGLNEVNNLINENKNLNLVHIVEEPQMSIRGVIEGFYGQPWSDQARKDLFKFMGEHRMNTYIYSPKDDDYLRKNWKELYPKEKLNELKELVDAANASHVDFVYTLSPGNDITYSSDEDYETTVKKFDQLRSIGVKQFYIALDDIGLDLRQEDWDKFPSHDTPNYSPNNWSSLADAQSYYLNRVERNYIQKNNLPDLWLVPTNYSGSAMDPFKEAQGLSLDSHIKIQWTGEGVFSGSINTKSIEQAKKTYHTEHLFIWDNFPVNDSDQDRLYLNPVSGRAKDLYKVTDGFTANPMIQSYASWFALGSYADYMWNADQYNPKKSLEKVIKEIAGNDQVKERELRAFVDLNQYWNHADKNDQLKAPILSDLISNYENSQVNTSSYSASFNKLKKHLIMISELPSSLDSLKINGFYTDALPWIKAASHWAKAELASLDMENQARTGNVSFSSIRQDIAVINTEKAKAMYHSLPNSRTGKTNQIIPSVGDGVFQNGISEAYKSLDKWLGLRQTKDTSTYLPGSASTNLPQYANYDSKNMADQNLNTKFWSGRNTAKGDRITYKLNTPAEIQRIILHQAASDSATSGDMFTDASIYIGMKVDGSDKVKVGQVTPTGFYQLDLSEPVKGQYIFIISDKATNNWLQIREVAAYNNTGLGVLNITNNGNSTIQNATDGSIETLFEGKLSDISHNGELTLNFKTPVRNAKSIVFAGKASGKVEIKINNEWKDIGQIKSDSQFITLPITDSQAIQGIKLQLDSNQPEFEILDFGLSTSDFNYNQKATDNSRYDQPENSIIYGANDAQENSNNQLNQISTPKQKIVKISKIVMHTAYLYDNSGNRVGKEKIPAYRIIKVNKEKVRINGKMYYQISNNRFVAAENIDGILRKLKHNACIYNHQGKRVKHTKILKKNKFQRTYGKAVKIKHKMYYCIGRNLYVKVVNFYKNK